MWHIIALPAAAAAMKKESEGSIANLLSTHLSLQHRAIIPISLVDYIRL